MEKLGQENKQVEENQPNTRDLTPAQTPVKMIDDKQLLQELAQVIDAKKGFNLMAIDVRGLCQVADYFLIAEGNVDKHLEAIMDAVLDKAQSYGVKALYIEGRGADWLVIDFAGIMTHLMLPSTRERYKLERIWQSGKLVSLEI